MQQGDPYSIASSARASSVGGISRPRAFAVLRLMMRSNLVGACTGRSVGFSPLSGRSGDSNCAARRRQSFGVWRMRAVPCLSGNRNGLYSLQRGSGAYGRNGRDPAVDQEVCPDDVRRIVRREVNRQLRDFQRIGEPLAWIVGSEDILNRLALLFAWEATEHRRVRRA